MKGALNNVSLVDRRPEELGRFHREIQQQIAALRTALEEHAGINSAQAMDDLTGAIQALYRYASRPWHLPIDIAREQLLERYVEQTMVEIEWRYADGSGPCG